MPTLLQHHPRIPVCTIDPHPVPCQMHSVVACQSLRKISSLSSSASAPSSGPGAWLQVRGASVGATATWSPAAACVWSEELCREIGERNQGQERGFWGQKKGKEVRSHKAIIPGLATAECMPLCKRQGRGQKCLDAAPCAAQPTPAFPQLCLTLLSPRWPAPAPHHRKGWPLCPHSLRHSFPVAYLALPRGRRKRRSACGAAPCGHPLQSPGAHGPRTLAQGAGLAQLGRTRGGLPPGQGKVGYGANPAQGLQEKQGTRGRCTGEVAANRAQCTAGSCGMGQQNEALWMRALHSAQ